MADEKKTTARILVTGDEDMNEDWQRALEDQARELARAKEEMERLEQAQNQLMLRVVHELRAPVAAVQSYITLILRGWISEDEIGPTLKRMQERLQGLLDTTSDLIDLAHLKQVQDRAADEAEPCHLADVLLEVCDLLRGQADSKRQSLEIDIQDRPVVMARREHLAQIWTNLISNALKYTPEGGRIAVTLRAEGGMAVGAVEDSGLGIAAEDMEHLFQEFFRSNAAKASGEIGAGLGLAIVKKIIESYGGQVEATSRLGKGSRFTFYLPIDSG